MKKVFICLLFAIVFTTGYIFGSLSNSSLSAETDFETDNLLEKRSFHYLVVIIFSSPENFVQRQTIRRTWLLTKGNNSIKHYFALGTNSLSSRKLESLKEEHSSHEDILFLHSFRDSYTKLSEKLREVFKWVDKNIHFKFVLKVDDDSFVQLNALAGALKKLPQEKLYWGFFDGQASVKTGGKWKEKNWFLCDRYLPYAKGGGYVISQDLVHLISSVSNDLTLYENEDVSLGTWLAPFNVKRTHDPNFDTEFKSRGCLNSFLIIHKQTISMMEQKYKNLLQTGSICSQEYSLRNAYAYNWNVLPSRCCKREKVVL